MDAVLAARAPSTGAPLVHERVKPPRPTLQKLSSSDDIESYLDMFERVARQQGWPNEIWSTQLAGLLSGDALDAFSSVPAEVARSYAQVKEAILSPPLLQHLAQNGRIVQDVAESPVGSAKSVDSVLGE